MSTFTIRRQYPAHKHKSRANKTSHPSTMETVTPTLASTAATSPKDAKKLKATKTSKQSSKKTSATKAKAKAKQPQPYSPYTIYFRLERLHILQSLYSTPPPSSYDPSHYDPNEHPRPLKYKDTKLPPYWYSSLSRAAEEKKRKHRKSEGGGCSKEELTGLISRSWKEVDSDVMEYCRRLSEGEKRRVAVAVPKAAERADSVNAGEVVPGQGAPVEVARQDSPMDVFDVLSDNAIDPANDLEMLAPMAKRVPLKKRPIHFISAGKESSLQVNNPNYTPSPQATTKNNISSSLQVHKGLPTTLDFPTVEMPTLIRYSSSQSIPSEESDAASVLLAMAAPNSSSRCGSPPMYCCSGSMIDLPFDSSRSSPEL